MSSPDLSSFDLNNLFAVSALINAITAFTIGVIVLVSGERKKPVFVFVSYAAAVTVWSVGYYFWMSATTVASAALWVNVLNIGSAFIPIIYYHWVVSVVNVERPLLVKLGYVLAVFFSCLTFSSEYVLYFTDIAGFRFWPQAGPFYGAFVGTYLIYSVLAVWELIRTLRIPEHDESRSAKRILAIVLVIGLVAATNFPLWYGIPLIPFGNFFVFLQVFALAYAMIRYGILSLESPEVRLAAGFIIVAAVFNMSYIHDLSQFLLRAAVLVISLFFARILTNTLYAEKLANKRQEVLIHFIGHEVKGFLAKDSGTFAALLEGDFGKLPEKLRPFVTQALYETRHGADSVMNILKASNLKKGTVTYTKALFDLKSVAAKEVEESRPGAEGRGLTLVLSAPDEKYEMVGDAAQIEDHVLHNLIDNAVNYTPSGSITVSLLRRKGKIIFSVMDTGIGIDEEDRKHLFTEGGHGKDSQRINAHSTGYGLYIAKSIVEAHGGSIRAESLGAGRGSTFVVEFPVNNT